MSRKSAGNGANFYLEQREDSPYWYLCEYNADTGRVSRRSTRTADHEAAKIILAEHVLKTPQRVLISEATVTQVMVRYWWQVASKHFSKSTAKVVMARVATLEPLTPIFNWPAEAQREFIAKLAPTPATQRRYWGIIRTAAAWMSSDEVKELPSMPMLVKLKDKSANSKGRGVRPFSVAELKQLFAAAKHEHEQRLLLLCLVTDHRPGAVLELTWDRIDLEHGFADMNVPGRPITNKRRSIAPLSASAVAYLQARRSIGPVVQWKGKPLKGFSMTFKRLIRESGVPGSAYRIRKGVASFLRAQGISGPDIKAMLSHSLGGETDEYAHYDPAFMAPVKAALERLLALIEPPWLAPYLPAASAPPTAANESLFSGAVAANDGEF